MLTSMSEVEALLSVDAGKVPPATVAFFAIDDEASEQRAYALLAAMTSIAAVWCALLGAANMLLALMVLIAAIFAIVATPTVPAADDPPRPAKRHVMVVTPEGLIVRDAWGLRSWRFEDLAAAVPSTYDHRPYIVLVERDGTRHALDYLSFQRGERLRQVIGHRLKLTLT
jgi:hypothetical protein